MTRALPLIALSCLLSSSVLASENDASPPASESDHATETTPARDPVLAPKGLGLEAATGIYGSMSFAEVGVVFPQLFPHFASSFKLVGMSALTWASFTDLDTGKSVSVHPVVVGGVLTVGGTSELVHGFLRAYGGVDLLLGHTLTPYDSYFYDTGNVVGNNVTYGVFGTFGIELFTNPKWAIFLESGGGFKSPYLLDEETQAAVAVAWLGSGVTLRMGTRFYLW